MEMNGRSTFLFQQVLIFSINTNSLVVLLIPLSFKRLSTIRNADIIYVIQGGSVIEAGDHDNLIKKDGAYKNLVSRQMQAQKKLDGGDGK